MKIQFWIGIIAVFGIITLFSTENIVQEQIQSNDIKTSKNQIKLESTTTQLVSTNIPVSTQRFNSEYVITKLPDTSTTNSAIQKAYGITSTQSSLSVTTWQGGGGGGFDSSWNVFGGEGQNKITFVNIGNNTKKTWIIPNDNVVASNVVADSNGYAFFLSYFPLTEERGLMRLNPSTNEFTKYSFAYSDSLVYLDIDSSNNIYFTSQGYELFKFALSTNTLKKWSGFCGYSIVSSFNVDSSGNAYCTSYSTLRKFDASTNTLTSWTLPVVSVFKSATDSSGNLFFTEFDGTRNKIGRITIADNTLTEWIVPIETSNGYELQGGMAVDSTGNVFFSANGYLWRLVPSTDTFTKFGVGCYGFKFEPSGALHCSSGPLKIT